MCRNTHLVRKILEHAFPDYYYRGGNSKIDKIFKAQGEIKAPSHQAYRFNKGEGHGRAAVFWTPQVIKRYMKYRRLRATNNEDYSLH